MTLYDIDSKILSFLENGLVIDEETGEVFDSEAFQAEMETERRNKIEGIALYIKNLAAEVKAIKNEEKKLKARQLSKEKRIDFLKTMLLQSMQKHGERKYESALSTVSMRSSKSVQIDDSSKFMEWAERYTDEFLKYSAPSIDKTAVKNALMNGREIPGASIEAKDILIIK